MHSYDFLVAGALGFIGSHLSLSLLERGYTVLGVDNHKSSNPNNLKLLQQHKNFHFEAHDICTARYFPVRGIFHLACPASPPFYQDKPIQTTLTSVLGTYNLLQLAKSLSVPILFTSTSEVYGDPLLHPQREDYRGNVNPLGIRSCYDEGKRCAESLCMDFHREYGLNVKIVRIFNTYGPHMHPKDGRVVSNFILQCLCHQAITIYGTGHQTRSFCYVEDTVRALLQFMFLQDAFPGPINVGNPHEVTVGGLAEKIRNLTASQSSVQYVPLPEDDPKIRKPDITLAKKILSWEPSVSLQDGLQRTITYFRELLQESKLV